MRNTNSQVYAQQISITQYLKHLWVLPVLLLAMQAVIRLTSNPVLTTVSPWLSMVAPIIFIITFTFAAFWIHQPIRRALKTHKQFAIEQAMASLPIRAIKAFGLASLVYIIYLLAVISISSSFSEQPLTPRMMVALYLSITFGLGILTPTIAVALTMAWMAKSRKRLSSQNLFIGNLEHFSTYPWIIRSSNRPWLIFAITSLIPVSILGVFTWLMLGTTDESEQHFILMQAIVLFCHLILGGTALVWVTSRTIHRITRELISGLNFLRQGKFDGHVAIMMDDDMGDLARGLNTALAGLKERDTLKDALAIASDIQKGLMPRGEPNIKGYTVSGFQESCYAVGGDYYDYIKRENGNIWLVIADVAGKGYPAALTVANLQAMLHALANGENISLFDAVKYANQSLFQSLQGGRFVTLFIAELNPETHTLEWLNAGHIPPLLWEENHIIRLEATTPPLGMLEQLPLRTETLTFMPGNVLFACTDGITEAKNKTSDMFNDHRVETWFSERHALDPSVLPESLLARMQDEDFTIHDDDITMLCLKRRDA
ncbi:MAG: PP2C family protein-serine/threonine phosphatase [Ghiorsea sp.]|nr:PP2C family protein-serine/threonine phosphatase [Ghiorsea sp.]